MQLFVQIKGAKKFARALNEAPAFSRKHLANALNESAYFFLGKAKDFVPRRRGDLGRSITVIEANPSHDRMAAAVGTNLLYAPYQEFGTGIYAGRPPIRPKRAKVLRFKTRGGKIVFARSVKGTPPTKYMQKASTATQPIMNKLLPEALELITKDIATK